MSKKQTTLLIVGAILLIAGGFVIFTSKPTTKVDKGGTTVTDTTEHNGVLGWMKGMNLSLVGLG